MVQYNQFLKENKIQGVKVTTLDDYTKDDVILSCIGAEFVKYEKDIVIVSLKNKGNVIGVVKGGYSDKAAKSLTKNISKKANFTDVVEIYLEASVVFADKVSLKGRFKFGKKVSIGSSTKLESINDGIPIDVSLGVSIGKDCKIQQLILIDKGSKIGNNFEGSLNVIGKSCTIGNSCVFGGGVNLDNNIKVGDNVKIGEETEIFSGVSIPSGTTIKPIQSVDKSYKFLSEAKLPKNYNPKSSSYIQTFTGEDDQKYDLRRYREFDEGEPEAFFITRHKQRDPITIFVEIKPGSGKFKDITNNKTMKTNIKIDWINDWNPPLSNKQKRKLAKKAKSS